MKVCIRWVYALLVYAAGVQHTNMAGENSIYGCTYFVVLCLCLTVSTCCRSVTLLSLEACLSTDSTASCRRQHDGYIDIETAYKLTSITIGNNAVVKTSQASTKALFHSHRQKTPGIQMVHVHQGNHTGVQMVHQGNHTGLDRWNNVGLKMEHQGKHISLLVKKHLHCIIHHPLPI